MFLEWERLASCATSLLSSVAAGVGAEEYYCLLALAGSRPWAEGLVRVEVAAVVAAEQGAERHAPVDIVDDVVAKWCQVVSLAALEVLGHAHEGLDSAAEGLEWWVGQRTAKPELALGLEAVVERFHQVAQGLQVVHGHRKTDGVEAVLEAEAVLVHLLVVPWPVHVLVRPAGELDALAMQLVATPVAAALHGQRFQCEVSQPLVSQGFSESASAYHQDYR